MKTNVLTLIITLVVGVVLAGSLLAPVVSDAKTTLGNPTTVTNEGLYNLDWRDAITIEMQKVDTNMEITIDGSSFVPTLNAATPILLTTDVFVGAYVTSGTIVSVGSRFTDPNNIVYFNASTITTASITVENGHITIVRDSETILDADCGKVLAYKEDGAYTVVSQSGFNTMKIGSDKDVIFMGAYYTGALDCFYDTYSGTAGAYTLTKTITKALEAGTTDIYAVSTGTVTISDGTTSETFTPFYGIFKETIMGHEAAGSTYTLVGVIPIMVIVAILMVAVGAIAYRRAD